MREIAWFGAGSLCAFALGLATALRVPRGRAVQPLLAAAVVACGVPWLLFLAYFTHFFDVPWYFEWRAAPSTDWLPSLVGVSVGIGYGWRKRWARAEKTWQFRTVFPGAFIALGLVVLAHAKPLLIPLNMEQVHDAWERGACLQSTPASCGPCSAATVLRALGQPATEGQLASEAHTSMTGTFNWLLVRAIRRLGFTAHYRQPDSLDEVAAPAIVGVRLGEIGHFVAYLGRKDGRYLVGDPLDGMLELGAEELAGKYRMDRFAIEVAR